MGVFLLALVCLSAGQAESFRTPFSNALEREVRSQKTVRDNPGMERLHLMRFYFPNMDVKQEEGFWDKLFGSGSEEAQERAAAFYLFNMYASTAAYGEDMPARLTSDYLGVLDAFGKLQQTFDVKKAESFYNKHKPEIKSWLEEFFKKIKFHTAYNKNDTANDKRELAFMRLLAQTPVFRQRPAYYIPAQSRLAGNISAADAELVSQQLRRSLAQDKGKVVTFEQAYVRGEDLDRKVGIKSSNVERTYRCVNDECEYCSYEFGKRICRLVNTSGGNWGYMRVYKITAVPLGGGMLVPARGNRFTLFSGTAAPKWNYHTATLLVMNRNGKYTPMVADKFLAGETPMAFSQWQSLFAASKTMFYIAPFSRTRAMDGAVKTPESVKGNNVVVDGYVYEPAPIEW